MTVAQMTYTVFCHSILRNMAELCRKDTACISDSALESNTEDLRSCTRIERQNGGGRQARAPDPGEVPNLFRPNDLPQASSGWWRGRGSQNRGGQRIRSSGAQPQWPTHYKVRWHKVDKNIVNVLFPADIYTISSSDYPKLEVRLGEHFGRARLVSCRL